MAKNNHENESNGINLIGVGTKIKGNIESGSDIRIDGTVNGNLKIDGKVVVGESGTIKGEVYCVNGDISGKIEGKVIVDELLSLKSNANINGDIIVDKLAIEAGCSFTGNCKMKAEANTDDTKNFKPKAEKENKQAQKEEAKV